MRAAQDEAKRPFQLRRGLADPGIDLAVARRVARAKPGDALAEERDRDRRRQQDAVRRLARERQHPRPRRGKHDRDVARRVDQTAPTQPIDRPFVVEGFAGIEPAADLDRLGQPRQRALRDDPGGVEIARRAHAEREHHPAGIELVERRRRHRRVDRMDRERAQGHQRDFELFRCRQCGTGQRHRIAQKQVRRDPQRLRAARFGRASLRRDLARGRKAVERYAEFRHRIRNAPPARDAGRRDRP